LRVAVVSGMVNVQKLLPKLAQYDYVEVMACPGGCIGGGGQPIPTNQAIREARAKALHMIDKGKPVREAHKNKSVIKTLDWLKEKGEKREHQILHTKYFKRG
jgi:iron only hydrogenase large subunit-like protein